MVALYHHMLKQGYKPNQITMLTVYRGQLLEIRRGMKKAEYQGVWVAVVNDFQGEENDIILLSLVRSNSRKDIAFIKTANRICVSLSRAKKGFYVIGNLSMFRGNDGTVWVNILLDMEKRFCVGRALPLYCQNHPESKVFIEMPDDFSKCPEGGCLEKCPARLKCGHKCPRFCHPYDREHVAYRCDKRCPKQLSCGHNCERNCYQCEKGCPPCKKKVPKDMKCGHTILLPCNEDPNNASCKEVCKKKMPCGHLCKLKCSEPCSKLCHERIKKELLCGHNVTAMCSKHPQDVNCDAPCSSMHLCTTNVVEPVDSVEMVACTSGVLLNAATHLHVVISVTLPVPEIVPHVTGSAQTTATIANVPRNAMKRVIHALKTACGNVTILSVPKGAGSSATDPRAMNLAQRHCIVDTHVFVFVVRSAPPYVSCVTKTRSQKSSLAMKLRRMLDSFSCRIANTFWKSVV